MGKEGNEVFKQIVFWICSIMIITTELTMFIAIPKTPKYLSIFAIVSFGIFEVYDFLAHKLFYSGDENVGNKIKKRESSRRI